jgi:hypothetical protein
VTNTVAFLGAREAGKRIAVLFEGRGTDDEPPQMIFILKRRPFDEAESADMAERWTLARPLIVPGRHVAEPYASLFSGATSLEQFAEAAPDRVDPVTDDRPFFFARTKPWGLPDAIRNALLGILAPLLVLCAVFVRWGRPEGQPARPYGASLVYFASLGVGFIAVELSLLQHLTLLLGHPIFTLSILLFTLLAAGGLGSGVSGRFRITPVCLTIAGLGFLYALVLPRLVPALLHLPLPARIVLAVLIVVPLGFAMGMPFPRGLALTGRGSLPASPFYWGLNGIFSVVGSLATMVAALVFGFTTAMIAGSALYGLAAVASLGLPAAEPQVARPGSPTAEAEQAAAPAG